MKFEMTSIIRYKSKIKDMDSILLIYEEERIVDGHEKKYRSVAINHYIF